MSVCALQFSFSYRMHNVREIHWKNVRRTFEAFVCTSKSAVCRWTRCIQIAFLLIEYFSYELILLYSCGLWKEKKKPWNKISGTIVLEVNARFIYVLWMNFPYIIHGNVVVLLICLFKNLIFFAYFGQL